jgi:predicted KAP-like P-loop ATPase
MTSIPVESDARSRLREAQAAESAALKAVQRAQEARSQQEQRLAAAQGKVTEAIAELVRVSGAHRAARLADEPLKAVRRMARDAGVSQTQIR